MTKLGHALTMIYRGAFVAIKNARFRHTIACIIALFLQRLAT